MRDVANMSNDLFKNTQCYFDKYCTEQGLFGELILRLGCAVILVVEKQHLKSSFHMLTNEVLAKEMLTKNIFGILAPPTGPLQLDGSR